ncbi:hypothetical protein C7446_2040 [Kushneria sinocarnis]|uniref:Uncharacterized protein n=2 Tax=Kushneria sinocarnis TaxID=595502 RepID=A0A420WWM2_9GAMM|nr:hypothetical protein C7446_2040 [Kushneria sinocarnis]
MFGCRIQKDRCNGAGASAYSEYHSVLKVIENIPTGKRAIGHYLHGPWDTIKAGKWLDHAAETIEQRLYESHPGFRKWSRVRKHKVHYLARVMLMAHRQCAEDERPVWSPGRIRKCMWQHFGETLETRYWKRNWQSCWQALEDALDELNAEILAPVDLALKALDSRLDGDDDVRADGGPERQKVFTVIHRKCPLTSGIGQPVTGVSDNDKEPAGWSAGNSIVSGNTGLR